MATKKTTTTKVSTKTAKKSTPKASTKTAKAVKKPEVKKEVFKSAVKLDNGIYASNISVLLGMAIEALILFLAYVIIMSRIS